MPAFEGDDEIESNDDPGPADLQTAELQRDFVRLLGEIARSRVMPLSQAAEELDTRDRLLQAAARYAHSCRASGWTAERMLADLKALLPDEVDAASRDLREQLASDVISWAIRAYYSLPPAS